MKRALMLAAIFVAFGIGLYVLRPKPESAPATPRRVEADSAPERKGPPSSTRPRTTADKPAARDFSPARPVKPTAPAQPAPSPAPDTETATLMVTSDVPGAQVFIDREFVGATPVTAPNLKPGSHRLNVSATGYEGHAETVDLAPGLRRVAVSFKAINLDVTLEVLHKHRLGSCKGSLVATPEGIRYETSDKDDAFSVSLNDIQTFEVDYLQKNLRVQPRKGKRYDFTDPEGNADRLFVFHRDVQKARERLK